MTVIVEPSKQRGIANHHTVAAIARWGQADWIVPSTEDVNASLAGLTGAPLNAAAITNPSGLDVKIDTFEAFVGGAYLASDDASDAEHTHTLAGSSTTTTLYLGYDISAADTIIFGPSSEFAAADPKVPIADVTDDGSSVTATLDRRPVGLSAHRGTLIDSVYDTDDSTPLELDTGALSETYERYNIVIVRESHSGSLTYQDLRLNGSSGGNYDYDWWDASQNTGGGSQTGQTEFSDIAGVNDGGEPGACYQVLCVKTPREIVANSKHYPIVEMVEPGVGFNVDYLMHGHFSSDTDQVEQLHIFGGGSATGLIEIYGRGLTYGG